MMIKQKFAPKHQRLIRQCYPGGRGVDKRPNASELSYLLYYVSTRRAKLAKVGAYLEKTIGPDVNRGRMGNVQVTLLIVNGLIEKCPEDMNLIAYNVVKILDTVITSKDLNLCQNSIKVFNTVCATHDESLFSGDPEYISLFHDLVTKYVSLAEVSTGVNALQWRQVSVDAAKALAGSKIPSTHGGMNEITVIMPLLLSTLYKDDNGAQLFNISQEIDKNRRSSEGSPGPLLDIDDKGAPRSVRKQGTDLSEIFSSTNEENLALTAFSALKSLLDYPGGMEIRRSVRCMLDYMLQNKLQPLWCIVLLEIGAKWTPVQLRFFIISALVDKLMGMKMAELDKQLVVCQFISSLLSSAINMIGLSILDLLKALLSHQHRVIRNKQEQATNSSLVKKLIVALSDCIASLGTHIYYADQLCDIVDDLLGRCLLPAGSFVSNASPIAVPSDTLEVPRNGTSPSVKASAASTNTASKLEAELVTNDLNLVRQIFIVARASLGKPELNPITLSEWEGTSILLTSDYEKIRIAFAACFVEYLHNDISEQDRLNPIGGSDTSNEVLGSIVQGATMASAQVGSHLSVLLAFYHLFVEVTRSIPVQSTPAVLSSMISLYTYASTRANGESMKFYALPSMALAVLKNVALDKNLNDFGKAIDHYIDRMKSNGLWCDVFQIPLTNRFDDDINISTPISEKSIEKAPALDQKRLAESLPESDDTKKMREAIIATQPLIVDSSSMLRSPNLFPLTIPSRNSTPTVDSAFHVPKTRSLNQLRINSHGAHSNGSGLWVASPEYGSRSPLSISARPQYSPKVSELRLAVAGAPNSTKLGNGSIRSALSISSSFVSEKAMLNDEVALDNNDNAINLTSFLSSLNLKTTNERGKVAENS